MGNAEEEPASCSWVTLYEPPERGTFIAQSFIYGTYNYCIVSNRQKDFNFSKLLTSCKKIVRESLIPDTCWGALQ